MVDQAATKGLKGERDVVRDNTIFREKVRSEKRHAVLNENFDFNPKHLINVSEKVAVAKPPPMSTAYETKEEDLTDLKMKLSTLTQFPKQKFNIPQTASQEIGWDMDREFKTYVPKDARGKRQGPETSYVENYVTFQAKSPFIRAKPMGATEPAPKK